MSVWVCVSQTPPWPVLSDQEFRWCGALPYPSAMNRVFTSLVVAAVAVALLRDALPARLGIGPAGDPILKALTARILDSASDAAKLSIGLVGVLALWMGVMRVAERAGLIAALARVLRPLLSRVFPEVPSDHPALGAIVMNMAANLLGIGNAATPMGLEAMKQLQALNPHKKTASNAMVLFLALNTTHLTLIPARTIALRLANGSTDAANIVVPTALSTLVGMAVAFVVARALQGRFPVTPDVTTDVATAALAGAASPNGAA